jgi:hypothetical protein
VGSNNEKYPTFSIKVGVSEAALRVKSAVMICRCFHATESAIVERVWSATAGEWTGMEMPKYENGPFAFNPSLLTSLMKQSLLKKLTVKHLVKKLCAFC